MEDFQEVLDSIPEFGTPYIQTEIVGAESGGAISVWTPLQLDTPVVYKSQVSMHGDHGSYTISFEIKANSIDEAISLWKSAAQEATREYNDKILNQQLTDIPPDLLGATH